jgi:aminoglycoside phosphotransferase (APT) family kinase protein
LAIPVPLAMGHPAEGYPYDWAVYAWLPGHNANGTIRDLEQAAVDLAGFVKALRGIETTGAHKRGPRSRGAPLAALDEVVRRSVAQLGERIDGTTVLRLWQESLDAPMWNAPELWLHGDLLPGNLLVVDGRLSAVIDFGGLNVGDPACDLQPVWNVFDGVSRARYLAELDVDDASLLRGRGWTIYQAVTGLAYYWDTNPGMIRQTSRALAQVLADTSR